MSVLQTKSSKVGFFSGLFLLSLPWGFNACDFEVYSITYKVGEKKISVLSPWLARLAAQSYSTLELQNGDVWLLWCDFISHHGFNPNTGRAYSCITERLTSAV